MTGTGNGATFRGGGSGGLRICAVTTCRNDDFFLGRWIAHYGRICGPDNLVPILDGHDQALPDDHLGRSVLRLPHRPLGRVPAMRRRARVMSRIADALFHYYDVVIVCDVDEFLVVDPRLGMDLAAYLASRPRLPRTLSGLGLDVGQHLEQEGPLDPERPILEQRAYAHVSSRYTKPVVATAPVTWGSGMHRIKGRNFRIDPNLFVFHLGMVDEALAHGKVGDGDRQKTGWGGHLKRRRRLFEIITGAEPRDGDAYFPRARRWQSWIRPLYALNKPGMIPGDPVIRIPERFREVI